MTIYSLLAMFLGTATIGSALANDAALKKLAFKMTSEMASFREGAKVGIRPFFKHEVNMDPVAAERLYEKIYTAFNDVKDMVGFQYIDQRNIMALLQTREEFYMGDPTALLQEAQADLQIICKPQQKIDGLSLSCVASDLYSGTTYSTQEIFFNFD
ncbi:MAG: hypothetical protein R3261_05300, partial [Alphaproteobacteria bacterium]|nr:hypothetical protein [Alphaproteobacteria bacterium]